MPTFRDLLAEAKASIREVDTEAAAAAIGANPATVVLDVREADEYEQGALPDAVHIPRSLRRQLRSCGWTTTADAAFEAVIAGCAGREGSWVTGAMAQAYSDLHRAGVAHSVEAWSGDVLVGGLYGNDTLIWPHLGPFR